jgi:hypothetical protein
MDLAISTVQKIWRAHDLAPPGWGPSNSAAIRNFAAKSLPRP